MNLGFPEMLFLVVLGLLLVGPKKMPEIARQIGRAISEFRRASAAFHNQLQEELQGLNSDGTVSDFRNALSFPKNIVPDLKHSAFEMLVQGSPTPQSTEIPHGEAFASEMPDPAFLTPPIALWEKGDHA